MKEPKDYFYVHKIVETCNKYQFLKFAILFHIFI